MHISLDLFLGYFCGLLCKFDRGSSRLKAYKNLPIEQQLGKVEPAGSDILGSELRLDKSKIAGGNDRVAVAFPYLFLSKHPVSGGCDEVGKTLNSYIREI